MSDIVISGSGLFIPPHTVTNDELVDAYNAYVERFNQDNAAAIEAGDVEALPLSSSEFIEKASGIKSRYAMHKEGMLDIDRMKPIFEPSSAENGKILETVTMSVEAAKEAMARANKTADDIDLVILATANIQRSYPATAIEVQQQLGIKGFAYDMTVACSSATFGLINAFASVKRGWRSVYWLLTLNLQPHKSILNHATATLFLVMVLRPALLKTQTAAPVITLLRF